MPDIFIDIESAAGSKYGSGPINTVLSWRSTENLNMAGDFSFTFPAADVNGAAIIGYGRRARAYVVFNNTLPKVEIGGGVIESIRRQVQGGINVIECSGPNLMIELSYRSLHFTQIADPTTDHPTYVERLRGATHLNMPNCLDGNVSTYDAVDMLSTDFIYIRGDRPFNQIIFDLSVFNATDGSMQAQYFDGDGWVLLTLTDGTESGGVTLAQDGTMSFTEPTDWQPVNHNNDPGYWFRMSPVNGTTTVRYNEITINTWEGAADDIADMMTLAPSGWSLDTVSYYNSTINKIYARFSGESVLSGLVMASNRSGENFRLGSGKQIQWLRNDQPASGLRAVQVPADPVSAGNNIKTVLILTLVEEESGPGLISRIYPYGAGLGSARLDLSACTRSPASGYTLDTTNNFIKNTAAESTYGQIEVVLAFKDIEIVHNDVLGRETAANQLYDAAYTYLRDRVTPAKYYTLSVAKIPQAIKPGDVLDVVYDGDGLTLNETLAIMAVTTSIDSAGIMTADLVVTAAKRARLSFGAEIADLADKTNQLQGHPQPMDESTVVSHPTYIQNTGWAIANVTPDKQYDANSTSIAELGDVLGTLIGALKEQGILGD